MGWRAASSSRRLVLRPGSMFFSAQCARVATSSMLFSPISARQPSSQPGCWLAMWVVTPRSSDCVGGTASASQMCSGQNGGWRMEEGEEGDDNNNPWKPPEVLGSLKLYNSFKRTAPRWTERVPEKGRGPDQERPKGHETSQ
eukprot:8645108-Pyramimonas_sp.AAC.1